MIQSTAKRAKRSRATMHEDAERVGTKWYSDVMPDGKSRRSYYEAYEWPPQVEYNIEIPSKKDPKLSLFTQVDAIFKGGPFGEDIAIVDWKTGGTKHASPSQLHVYRYGLSKLGWFDEHQTGNVGWFHHADFGARQIVDDYIGDDIVAAWIANTYLNKERMIENQSITFSPDWYCNYCRARDACPIVGQGDYQSIVDKLVAMPKLAVPQKEST